MNMFEKLKQRIRDASTDFDCYELPGILKELQKDYAEHRAEVYDEVCKELQITIERAREKRKDLLPL